MKDASYQFAAFIANTRYEDIPPEIVDIVKKDILDTIGCMLAGSGSETIRKALSVMEKLGGAEECKVFSHGGKKLNAIQSAFVNGSSVFVVDFDDLCDPANLHIGAASIPVALAMAEKLGNVSGRDFITAVTVGMEIACRLGIHTVRRTPGEVMGGWDYIFTLGIFSAAAIAAKLMGLDEAGIQDALGIAYHQAAGTSISARDKADTKIMGSGFACMDGILSAMMAQEGLTGAKRIIDEMPGSFATQYNAGCDSEALVAGLGSDYALKYLGFKAYPCCGNVQRHIDAVLNLIHEHDIKPEEITAVNLNVAEEIYAMCDDAGKTPNDMLAAQFSIPWTSACAAAKGKVSIPEFTEEGLKDPETLAMAQKIHCFSDPELAHYRMPARVEIVTERGAFETHTKEYQTGHWANPISREKLEVKFHDCAAYSNDPVSAERQDEIIRAVGGLEEMANAMTLVDLIP